MKSSPASKDLLRIAFIGLKGINLTSYLPSLKRMAGCVFVGGVDVSAQVRDSFSQSTGIASYASLDALLAAENVQAVFIGTPNPVHLENICEASAKKLHISVTKPLCNTVDDCLKAISACADSNVILQTGHEYRFRPSMLRARQLVQEGLVGRPTLISAHMGHGGGLSSMTEDGTWRGNPKNVPGGCLNLLGVHMIDIANAVFGTPCSVSGHLSNQVSPSGIQDTASVFVSYAGGQIASITASYVSPKRHSLVIHGTEANIFADDLEVCLVNGQKKEKITDLSDKKGTDVIVAQFHRAITEGISVETDGAVGLSAVAVLEAALRSFKERRHVEIEDYPALRFALA